ncbi:hypothetical protein HBA43_17330 [Providencia rettgeri]|uniref:Uncharacterized protein n=1 Tax=Providencia rettgeri TaxID=587 RepID=A0A379FTG6_PRORE|nr:MULTISPECIES: hypothetical protein [Providencia]EJD6672441.1 hypothetical protein [Providencia rettgeri]MCG5371950.1 hypothetical protein [Providencia rettgeri]MCL0008518.1 hypothetical protein [Providencia rettgeri]NIA76153.1 hypothetical protein [Providencia rettgeri]NIA80160.1 hypothetical protein [Providencia rettgeri]
MKIEYIAMGNTAKITILSFVTERRLLNRLIDKALLSAPVHEASTGFFFRVTTIYGKANHVLHAYKIISKEANK